MSDPIGRMYARQVAALAAIAGPVVPPRPRVSEHTDSARLEATRDAIRTGTAPRPRVEGEVVTPEELDERAWMIRDMGFEGTRRDLKRAAGTIRSLTAEVERLRGVMEGEIEWLDGEAMRSREQEEAEARLLGVSPSTAPMAHFFNRKDKLRAALALLTPAPEAKE